MAQITMSEMLKAGVHFGHQTRRWNPKMRPYIFGARNGIHIIDLQQTVKLFRVAYDKVVDTVANGGKVLFIGTKRQAQEAVATEATKANQYYVTNRWMGGTLTNFVTIQKSVERLKKLEGMFADGSINRYQKKEILLLEREMQKLEQTLGGIKNMDRLPQLAFIIDPHREDIAVKECRKLGIPISMGHKAENVHGAELVVYTAAIMKGNPEIEEAHRLGIPTVERSILLGYVANTYPHPICIAGTHGKTTTTAMTTQIMVMAHADPAAVIGGKLPLIDAYGRYGTGREIVVEACEYSLSLIHI